MSYADVIELLGDRAMVSEVSLIQEYCSHCSNRCRVSVGFVNLSRSVSVTAVLVSTDQTYNAID